jgi:hypothetical protein
VELEVHAVKLVDPATETGLAGGHFVGAGYPDGQ